MSCIPTATRITASPRCRAHRYPFRLPIATPFGRPDGFIQSRCYSLSPDTKKNSAITERTLQFSACWCDLGTERGDEGPWRDILGLSYAVQRDILKRQPNTPSLSRGGVALDMGKQLKLRVSSRHFRQRQALAPPSRKAITGLL